MCDAKAARWVGIAFGEQHYLQGCECVSVVSLLSFHSGLSSSVWCGLRSMYVSDLSRRHLVATFKSLTHWYACCFLSKIHKCVTCAIAEQPFQTHARNGKLSALYVWLASAITVEGHCVADSSVLPKWCRALKSFGAQRLHKSHIRVLCFMHRPRFPQATILRFGREMPRARIPRCSA